VEWLETFLSMLSLVVVGMAASGKGIEAGKAYVKAYVDDNPLTRGLRRAEIAMRRTLRSMGTAGKIADRGWKNVSRTVRGIARDVTATDQKFQRLASRAKKATVAGAKAVGKGFGAAGRGVGAALSGAGGAVAGAGAGLLGAGGAVGALLGKAVGAAGAKQATLGKFGQVFGDAAEQVGRWGDTLAAEIGRGETEVKGFLAGTQDLLVPIGFEPGAAAEMSKQVTKLAYDLASFNDVADSEAMNDLQAALTGSGEVMKKYGVIVSETTTNQALLDAGITPKTATEAQKTWARFQLILKGTSAAQGDAARTSGEWSNVVKRLQSDATALAESVGEALLPVITPVAGKIGQVVQAGTAWLAANPQIARGVALVALALVAGGAALLAFGTAAVVAGAMVTGTVTVVSALAAAVGFLLSPVGLAVVAVTALAGGAAYALYQSGILGETVAWLAEKFGPLADMATRAFEAIKKALAADDFAAAARVLWAALQLGFANGIAWVKGAWIGMKAFLATAFIDLAASVRSVWSSMTETLVRLLAGAASRALDILATLAEKMGLTGRAMQIRFLASGLGTAGIVADTAGRAEREAITRQRIAEEEAIEADAARERAKLADSTDAARAEFEAAISAAAEAKPDTGPAAPPKPEEKPGGGGPPGGSSARGVARDAINRAAIVGTNEGVEALLKAITGATGDVSPDGKFIATEIAKQTNEMKREHREAMKNALTVKVEKA
jgi:hypothetical protein